MCRDFAPSENPRKELVRHHDPVQSNHRDRNAQDRKLSYQRKAPRTPLLQRLAVPQRREQDGHNFAMIILLKTSFALGTTICWPEGTDRQIVTDRGGVEQIEQIESAR